MQRLAHLLGLEGAVADPEQTLWAVRKTFEAIASRGPLVVDLDDLHWAEPTLLDLVEHIADWSRGAPDRVAVLGAPGVPRRPAELGRRQDERDCLPARTPPRGRDGAARARPARRRAGPGRRAGRGRVRGQPAVRPADGRDDRRGRPRARGRPRRAADDPGVARCASGPARRRGARRDRARLDRGQGLPPGRRPRAHRRGVPRERRRPPALARPPRPDPPRRARCRRRGRVRIPASDDPRRRVRRDPEGDAGGPARAVRRVAGERSVGPLGTRRDRRATTSTARIRCAPSSDRSTTRRERSAFVSPG